MLFSDKQAVVKRAVLRDASGSQFNDSVKWWINRARSLISKEARWKQLRTLLEPAFSTKADLSTGTATFTEDSKTVTFSGVDLVAQGVEPGRRIKAAGSGDSATVFEIISIDSATQVTLNKVYDDDNSTGTTYTILGQERYSLPFYFAEISFLWHEKFGYPYILTSLDEREFFFRGFDRDSSDTPTSYYISDPFGVSRQPSEASLITIVSSSTSDTSASSIKVILFGIVGGVPDQESLTVNGTTSVTSTKAFTSIHRVVKTKSTTGTITITDANSDTLATLSAGDAYSEPFYERVGLNPIPDVVIPINAWGYRRPIKLVNGDDVSEFGPEFDQIEILLASAIGNWEERQKEEGDKLFAAYGYELSRLKSRNTDRLDRIRSFKRFERSNFGEMVDSRLHPNLLYRQLGANYGPLEW